MVNIILAMADFAVHEKIPRPDSVGEGDFAKSGRVIKTFVLITDVFVR